MCRLVSDYRATSVTAVYYDISLLGVGLCLDGAENTAAGVGSVAGVDINVERAEAEGAMIARGISEGEHLLAAVLADKAVIVFCESFVFHTVPLDRLGRLSLRAQIYNRKVVYLFSLNG